MKRSNLTVILYLCLVFASGILVGGFGMRLYNARAVAAKSNPCSPDDMRRRYQEDMRTRLNLSDTQFKEFVAILESTGERFHELRAKYRPEVKVIQEEQVEKIRAILSDTQRAEYEKLREERERHQPPNGRRRPGC
jgi:hypothetical protein